jgi:hypothetical protein
MPPSVLVSTTPLPPSPPLLEVVDAAPPPPEPVVFVVALLEVLTDALPPTPEGVPVLAEELVFVALVLLTALALVASLVLGPVVDVAVAPSVTGALSLACCLSSLPQPIASNRVRIGPIGATRPQRSCIFIWSTMSFQHVRQKASR